jgi:hypothetical protein
MYYYYYIYILFFYYEYMQAVIIIKIEIYHLQCYMQYYQTHHQFYNA